MNMDLKDCCHELAEFLVWELGANPDQVRAMDDGTVAGLCALWETVQRRDPDPDPGIAHYMGDPDLGQAAEAFLEGAAL